MPVHETFFSVEVSDMQRAIAFYVEALGAVAVFASPRWTSLVIAGVRVGLAASADHVGGRVGLHFALGDLEEGCAAVVRAGGRVLTPALEVAPGVVIAEATDTEGNTFTLTRADANRLRAESRNVGTA